MALSDYQVDANQLRIEREIQIMKRQAVMEQNAAMQSNFGQIYGAQQANEEHLKALQRYAEKMQAPQPITNPEPNKVLLLLGEDA